MCQPEKPSLFFFFTLLIFLFSSDLYIDLVSWVAGGIVCRFQLRVLKRMYQQRCRETAHPAPLTDDAFPKMYPDWRQTTKFYSGRLGFSPLTAGRFPLTDRVLTYLCTSAVWACYVRTLTSDFTFVLFRGCTSCFSYSSMVCLVYVVPLLVCFYFPLSSGVFWKNIV